VAGHRVLVAGSGPLLLPTATALAAAGVRVLAVLEANPAGPAAARAAALAPFTEKVAEAAGYAKVLARHRVPVLTGRAVTACHGAGRVQRATISRLTRDWRPMPGPGREVAVDAVHTSFGCCPALDLSRLLGCADVPQPGRPAAAVWHDGDLATSAPGVFAAGETTGVAGPTSPNWRVHRRGGRRAVPGADRRGDVREEDGPGAGGPDPGPPVRASAGRPVPVPDRLAGLAGARYVMCRCEEVPWSAIGEAVAGARGRPRGQGRHPLRDGVLPGPGLRAVLQQAVATAAGRSLTEVGDLQSRRS